MEPIKLPLLEKFLQGNCSPEETTQVQEWLSDDESNLDILRNYMESQWDGKPALISSDTDQRMLSLLQQNLYPELMQIESAPARQRNMRLWKYIAAACCIPLLLFAGHLIFRSISTNKEPVQAGIHWIEVSNSGHATRKLQLPDGSRVWLSANSRLSYHPEFNRNADRELRLTGEAFFDVVHNEQYPFIIHTDSIQTTVLGTAFNIEAWPTEKQLRVSLINGKVSVGKKGKATTLSHQQLLEPGEALRWEKTTNIMHKEKLPPLDISQWTKGYMIFNDVLLSDALERVAQRYQLKLRYAANVHVEGRRITTVLKQDALNELIHILPFITPYKCSIQKDVLYVR